MPSKYDEQTLDRIFAGDLNDPPPLTSKIVRIFTSSTFTDMLMERNCLMEYIYPRIKDYCKEQYGLEFQVVDMRWGVRDEATDDHMTTELCMNEIKNCQRLSVGPNFVTFLGQKYGYRPIPTYIEGEEFRTICTCLNEMDIKEVDLLYTWYKEDQNAIPSTFILQPISSILFHFLNRNEPDLMAKDQSIWWETLSKLQNIFRIAADHLFKNGLMTADDRHNYFMSVTEREVINGVLNLDETKDTCLAYIRDIKRFNMTECRLVGNFIDLNGTEIDREAVDLLGDLRDNRLVKKINPENIIKYTLVWSENQGLNENDHYDYLVDFLNHFYKWIRKLVRRSMRKEDSSPFGKMVTEILHHSHSCNFVSRIFVGREPELESIRLYVMGKSPNEGDGKEGAQFRRPFVVHGEGGSGKTGLVAKAASMCKEWMGDIPCILLLRFMGTTPESSSVVPALKSICQQLTYNYTLPMDQIPDDLIPLSFYYKQLLLYATSECPLIMFIDSLDQLDGPSEMSLKLGWLTHPLPSNVKLILSCTSSPASEEFTYLHQMCTKTGGIMHQVQGLTHNLCVQIVDTMLKDGNRTLSGGQWKEVHECIRVCRLPIYLKLVYARVAAWKSYSGVQPLPQNVTDSITDLFERVENKHGKTLVSYALSYITASKSGLSESELEDLISLDDIVLNDIYQYHMPPIRRIPPLLWTRIRNDLPNYLTERDADGVSVMNWYHRQFRETSLIRYLEQEGHKRYFHSMMADYFIGCWGGGKEKPFKYTESQQQRFKLSSPDGQSDRKVPLQPNIYYAPDGKTVSRYNGRKFGEIPFHLTKSRRINDLFQMVLFNYEWVHSKLSCCSLQSVLQDYILCRDELHIMKQPPHLIREVDLMIDALRLSAAILIQFPSMFAAQMVGRLLPLKDEYPNIRDLLTQCDLQGIHHCSLVPITHCLHTPGGPLMYSLEGHSLAVFDFILTSDNRYILSVSNKFLMWDLSTGEISREVDVGSRGIMQELVITGDDKLALTYSNYNDVWALDILTGDTMCCPEDRLGFASPILGIEVSEDNRTCVVWCKQTWAVIGFYPKLRLIHRFDGEFELEEEAILWLITYESHDMFHISYNLPSDGDKYVLQSFFEGNKIEKVSFWNGIVIVDDTAYVGDEDGSLIVYQLTDGKWNIKTRVANLGLEHSNQLLSLIESHRLDFIIGSLLRGFSTYKIRDIGKQEDVGTYYPLPPGIRNISIIPLRVVTRLIFTKHNQYAVAGIRKNLYIWSVEDGNLLKTIDAHYGRIVEMLPLVVDDTNAVATSSLDRTVKVWNMNHIFEPVFSIDRMDLPIEGIRCCRISGIAVSVTRNNVGIWCLKTGHLKKILVDAVIGAIVTFAIPVRNGELLLSVESSQLLVWDMVLYKVINRRDMKHVRDMQPIPKRDIIVTTSCSDSENETECVYEVHIIKYPALDQVGYITFSGRIREPMRRLVTTIDGESIVLVDVEISPDRVSRDMDVIKVFSTSNGQLTKRVEMKNRVVQLVECAFKGKENVVGIICRGNGFILDVTEQRFMAQVNGWNAPCSRDGTMGLNANQRSGLQLISLTGADSTKVLLPKKSQGLIHFITGFTSSDQYVYYYHGVNRTIQLFRVGDGSCISNYRLNTEAKIVVSSPDGTSIIVGGADGSVTILLIVDPERKDHLKLLKILPSRIQSNKKYVAKILPLVRWKKAVACISLTNRQNSDSVSSKACLIC